MGVCSAGRTRTKAWIGGRICCDNKLAGIVDHLRRIHIHSAFSNLSASILLTQLTTTCKGVSVVVDVLLDECGDEVVRVVIPISHAQVKLDLPARSIAGGS